MRISNAVQEYVRDKNRELGLMGLGDRVQLEVWLNTAVYIEQRIDMLVRNGIIGLTLVFLLLWIFLDIRLAFWVSAAIPISLAGAMFLMLLVGETINMISLFAMIMVLGIIADDAIIVGESIYYHRKQGMKPIPAAVEGTIEVAMPVTAAVLTSCIAFAPMLFIDGIMGKFVGVIPTVVICALLVSLVECLIVLPAHLNSLPDMQKKRVYTNPIKQMLSVARKRFYDGLEWLIDYTYRPTVAIALSWRYATLALITAILLVTMGMLQGGLVKFEFFPSVDSTYIVAELEFPEGTPLSVTEQGAEKLEKAIAEIGRELNTRSGEPLVKAMQSSVGMKLINEQMGQHLAEVIVEFVDAEDRYHHSREIMRMWQDRVGTIPGVVSINFESDSGGPPGKPIEIWLMGRELGKLQQASEELKTELRTFAGVFQVEDDFRPGKRELQATLKPTARTLGLTTSDLANQLRQGFYGDEATRIQRGRDEVKVWVRYPREERASLASLDSIRIRTPRGDEVPLPVVADLSVEPGYTTITRKEGLRRIAVTADVFSEITNATEVINSLQGGFMQDLAERYPGMTWSLEGEKRNSQESLDSLFIGFPLAILGIYLLVATLFRSYVQPIVILLTVPFGIIGAIWGHIALGYTVTIMSLFGVVALSGVVVNDAIVYIEAANQRLARGMSLVEALVDAGARRFRAIVLTTGTTVGGLTPLLMEQSMQAQFLIPMA
ncbi:MAG: efflux RND transporter permease subunit, partial [Candidatus Sumerlaeia bacterium]|nr:efflux RND transporter permease subunit [Candidatus Sumerlaeia bacterium]